MVDRPHAGWWVSIVLGMGITTLLAASPGAYGWWHDHVTTLLPRGFFQVVAVAAWVGHVGEATVAYRLARRLGPGTDARGWFLQTLVLGFPSLGLIKKRVAA